MAAQVNTAYLTCPIRQVVSKFGDKWSLLVLYHLHQNAAGTLRFSKLHRRNARIVPRKCSRKRWRNLEQNHFVSRTVLSRGAPARGIFAHVHRPVAHARARRPRGTGRKSTSTKWCAR